MLIRHIRFIQKSIICCNQNINWQPKAIPKNLFLVKKFSIEHSVQINTDLDREKKLKIFLLEISVLRQEGHKAPDPETLKAPHWDHILSLSSRSARKKFYTFLWKNEKRKENDNLKRQRRKEEFHEYKKTIVPSDHISYGLMNTGFLIRIYDTTINSFNNNRLIQAIQFGQKLILDCSYDNHMNAREAVNAAKQLMFCFAENRMHDNPFDLHYCNINRNGITMKYLQQHIPTMNEPWFPLHIHEESFINLFDKEKLVYLTPHCKTDLELYNPDDIYIIGAMVDKVNNEPLSLGKAKQLGLRMARLPLDRYLQWSSGSGKSLALNQMTQILLELKDSGNWNEALKFVPRRKIVNQEIENRKSFKPDFNKYKFNKSEWDFNEQKKVNKITDQDFRFISKKKWK